MQKIPAL